MQKQLTKERYSDAFPDDFSLVNYAIDKARKEMAEETYEFSLSGLLEDIFLHPPDCAQKSRK